MAQGTIKDWDEETRTGSLLMEDRTEVGIDATSIEGSNIRTARRRGAVQHLTPELLARSERREVARRHHDGHVGLARVAGDALVAMLAFEGPEVRERDALPAYHRIADGIDRGIDDPSDIGFGETRPLRDLCDQSALVHGLRPFVSMRVATHPP